MKKRHIINLTVIVLVMFIQQLGLALVTPCLPEMSKNLNVSVFSIITYFIIGQGLGQIAWGTWSDVIGRKNLIAFGVFLFALSGILITLTVNPLFIIGLRFLQGFSASSIYSIATAIIADQSRNNETMIFNVAISDLGFGISWIILPLVGGFLTGFQGWKSNFYAMSILIVVASAVCLFFLTETRDFSKRASAVQTAQILGKMLINPKFLIAPIIMTIPNAFFFVFSTYSPEIMTTVFLFSPFQIGFSASILGVFYTIVVFANTGWLNKYSSKKIIAALTVFFVFTSFGQLMLACFNMLNIYTLMIPMIINVMAWGIIFPHISAYALMQYQDQAGSCASSIGFVFYLLTAFATYIYNIIFSGSFLDITIFTFIIPPQYSWRKPVRCSCLLYLFR